MQPSSTFLLCLVMIQKPSRLTIVPSPSLQIFNRILVGQMKQLARNKEHQLRLQMYTTLIDATVIALVNDDGSLQKCDTIVNLDCFGVFTDEKHALQYDPRGQHLQEMPMLQVLKKAIEQSAGSLWLNPKKGKPEESCTRVNSTVCGHELNGLYSSWRICHAIDPFHHVAVVHRMPTVRH